MRHSLARLGFLLLLGLWAAAAGAAAVSLAPISQVIAFGDSLSDTDNLYTANGNAYPASYPATPSYYNGRSSNGPVWVELLASDLGVALNNYAYAGAQTGSGNVHGAFPGLQTQLATFTSDLGGAAADPNALFTVWAGPNDLLSLTPGTDPTPIIANAIGNIVGTVLQLTALGAKKILVLSLPDLGLTPRATAAGLGSPLSALTDAFNAALYGNLPALDGLRTLDTAAFLRDAVASPGDFGLGNVADACLLVGCNGQTLDPLLDPDIFLFWDDIHPTRVGHAILADLAYETVLVPVPPAALLFASALGLLGWVRRRTVTGRRTGGPQLAAGAS